MNYSEAFTAVEQMFTAEKILDRWGDPLEGIQVIAVLNRYLPEKLTALEDSLLTHEISPDDYVDGMRLLVQEMRGLRFTQRAEKQLAGFA